MEIGNAYLNMLLSEYQVRLQHQKKELRRMPPGSLVVMKNGRFMQMMPASEKTGGRRIRRGITKNSELVNQLARKKYLEKSIKLLTEEINRTNEFLKASRPPTTDNILELLPKSYKTLPENMFFPKRRAAEKWAEWPYPQNTLYPEEKIHTTGRGLKVRSKSELFIADKLDTYLLLFQYDGIIYFEDYAFSPDFMIPTTEGMKYWEHCGKMAELKYRKRNQWKLTMYDKMGIVPWKNLIITYDSEDGGLNLGIIEAEIRNKLLPVRL